jgi:CheY-like chemotaxis protein
MDVQLPKLSVLEVTCKIRADPALAWVPVIAVTSLELWDDDGRALKLGCGAYISKPFRQRDPLGAIRRYPRSHVFSARHGDLEPFGSRPGPSQEGGERDGQ